jgi:ribosomal protein S18 acetylase RimI-like enzyme
MHFHIRCAQPRDAAQIAQVHLESWKTTYPGIIPDAYIASLNAQTGQQHWQQRIEENVIDIFVAQQREDNSSIFGFICGGQIREAIDSYDGELHAIYLLKQCQQQGAGRALVCTLAATLQNKGFKSMIVWALQDNPAVEFYKRLGAIPLTTKTINIGGKDLTDLALGWPSLTSLL